MAQRVTLAVPNPANPATDINVGTEASPLFVSSSGGGGTAASPSISGGEYNSTAPTLVNGGTDAVQLDSRGNQKVSIFSADTGTALGFNANNAAIGLSAAINNIRTVSFPQVFNGTTFVADVKPNQTSRIVSSAATTNATVAKATAGDLFRFSGYNSNAAARYLKIYNKGTAPVVGTDVPIWTEYLAPQAKFELSFPKGLYFSAGISYALVTGAADADATAVAAADILALNLAYA